MNHNEVERIVNDRIDSLLLNVIFELKQEFSDDLRNEYNLADESSKKISRVIETLERYHMSIGGRPIP